MSTTRLPYVIDALVDGLRALTGYRAPDEASGTPVFDGPEYAITGDMPVTWVAVGWSGDPDAPQTGADGGQVIASLGNRSREETGLVRMRVVSQAGDRDMKARRDAAFAVMADVENLVRTDPLIGLDPVWMREAEIGDRYTIQQEFAEGPVCIVDFAVTYRARI